jgi:hypothetical protein
MTELAYSKTPEEIFEENRMALIAEAYLKPLGVKVRTDYYNYYRDTYEILKDLGKYLTRENKIDPSIYYEIAVANEAVAAKIGD